MENNNNNKEKGGNISSFIRGLFRDSSHQHQPKGTYSFALNTVKETEEGDDTSRSNENSNELCADLPEGFKVIGKVYMSGDRICLFLCNGDENISEIGIFYSDSCKYETHVNDENSVEQDKLNFKLFRQIEAVYRLRRGCEDTVYFVSRDEYPRYYNFSSPHLFKNQNNNWVSRKFRLQKTLSKIPEFQKVEVLETGGNLKPGSYNFGIQFLDASLNLTEVANTSPVVKIYNSSKSLDYPNILGSINSDTEYIGFPDTNKTIKIEVANLDTDYPFYRIVIIESNNGSGQISSVKFSEPISTSNTQFYYTGDNYDSTGSREDILAIQDYITSAETITQLENRLLIGNTEGNQVPYCELQRYASKIKVDCVLKTVRLDSTDDLSNSKNPEHEFNNGLGYMPGEIYSLAIAWIFDDLTVSPGFHIPGKAEGDEDVVFSPLQDVNNQEIVFPMVTNNKSQSLYTDNEGCDGFNYWGEDYNGTPLVAKNVRHHRFPLRKQIKKNLVNTSSGVPTTISYYYMNLTLSGKLKIPKKCPNNSPDCGTDIFHTFQIRLNYTVGGVLKTEMYTINPQTYADNVNTEFDLDLVFSTPFYDNYNFDNIAIEITDLDGYFHPISDELTNLYFNTIPDINTFWNVHNQNIQERNFESQILGLRFSNIEKPPPINGKEVVGYYILRNERTESEKTILDSAVMFPTLMNQKYISHGLLNPDIPLNSPYPLASINKRLWAVLHPEHKFNNKHLLGYDEIIVEGVYHDLEQKLGKVSINDVDKGSSYSGDGNHDDDAHEADGKPDTKGLDGWSIDIISRDNIVYYFGNFSLENSIPKESILDDFYLDALESKSTQYQLLGNSYTEKEVYNISADNKIRIIHLDRNFNFNPGGPFPYVVFYRNNANPYFNFRTSKYYKEHTNPIYFGTQEKSTVNIFNGDSYITPMRYTSSVYWDNRVAKRNAGQSTWKFIVGAIMVVVGTVLSVVGIGAPILVGGLIVLAGAGVLTISSGIKQANYFKAYTQEYDKGLRKTALDDWVDTFYNYRQGNPFGFPIIGSSQYGKDGPSDDSIQWAVDAMTNLWFESSININLRNKFYRDETPTFLNAPWKKESGNDSVIELASIGNLNYQYSNPSRYPISTLEKHALDKLTAYNPDWNDNRKYLGIALGEYYHVNLDYHRREQEKIFFHLPIEYDCCSDCNEVFPHRIYYSEQSFQEELSDNYNIFLPNNYRDIEGESGEIKYMFTLGEKLFVLTEEGLWNLPSNHQERVTGQIVSFIGTGDYFSIPPRKIVEDDSGNSAGTSHTRGVIRTPRGVIFPNASQNKMYLFNNEGLNAISDLGLRSWFKDNSELLTDSLYKKSKRTKYPYADNPSNPFGTGYVVGYDSKRERALITKKDKKISLPEEREDFELCMRDSEMIIFRNMNDIIEEEEVDDWEYSGITENCRMRFSKDLKESSTSNILLMGFQEIVGYSEIHVFLPNEVETESSLYSSMIKEINSWISNIMDQYPEWDGELYFYNSDDNQRWLKTPFDSIKNNNHGGNLEGADLLVINLIGSIQGKYYTDGIFGVDGVSPNSDYIADLQDFQDNILPSLNSFAGLIIPVVEEDNEYSKQVFLHTMSSLFGKQMSSVDFYTAFDGGNEGFNSSDVSYLENYLTTTPNDFTTPLNQLGWIGAWKIGALSNSEPVETNSMINTLNQNLLSSYTLSSTPTTSIITTIKKIHKYIDGVPYEQGSVDNSWTLSYDLKENFWTSWHSYLPYFYINSKEKIFSLDSTVEGIWKHGKLGHYQNFYGERKPFIIEFVSNENPLATKIWDYIRLMTDAKKYYPEYEDFGEERFITFDKAMFYNSRQNSGILNLVVKDTDGIDTDYLRRQVQDFDGDSIIIDRNERDWTLNSVRDIRVDHSTPMFKKKLEDLQADYYIDKVLNEDVIDFNKSWSQQEVFRDKYLTIRLIFDTFDDIKLILKYSLENDSQSFR